MNNQTSAYVSGVLGGIMGSTIVGGLLALVLTTLPAEASTSRIVGYTEIGPDVCQVEFLSDDNEIYTFTDECSD